MFSMLKNIKSQYATGFWISTLIIVVISLLIFAVTNFTNLPEREVLDKAAIYSHDVSEILVAAEVAFDSYAEMISELIGDAPDVLQDKQQLLTFKHYLDVIPKSYLNNRAEVSGYFYKINAEELSADDEVYYNKNSNKKYHISMLMDNFVLSGKGGLDERFQNGGDAFWLTTHNPLTNKIYLTYVTPFYSRETHTYLGFVGVIIDVYSLESSLFKPITFGDNYPSLLTDKGEVLIHPTLLPGENISQLKSAGAGAFVDALSAGKDTGACRLKMDGHSWIYAFQRLPSGQIFVESEKLSIMLAKTNWLILLVAFFAILCMFMIHENQKFNITAFDWISNKMIGDKYDTEDSLVKNKNKAALSLHIGYIGSTLAYMVYIMILDGDVFKLSVCTFVLCVLLLFLKLHRSASVSNGTYKLFVMFMLVAPLVMHLAFGGFSAGSSGEQLIFMLVSVVMALFLYTGNHKFEIFDIFVILLFLNVLLELFIFRSYAYEVVFMFTSSLFFLAFSLHTSIRLYVARSERDYVRISNILKQLTDTQSLLVQKEKMVTLGQLVAGIAHEINTPMGAVKASAETISSAFENAVRNIMLMSRDFSSDDMDSFFKIVQLSTDSIREMRSTMEIRRAKKTIVKYLGELGVPNHEKITDMLIRMEICDLTVLEENIALFRNPKISDILKLACETYFIVTGTQTILVATSKISKIVFALRSYSHTNVSDEPEAFDIVRSIESVLVLYSSQFKSEIVINRIYDENMPPLVGNSDELGQVWTNIIQNALYAMQDGGTLTITVKNLNNNYIYAEFRDTGRGISPENLSRIFEPLFTTKPLGEGSGLGLDISKKIILKHKGTIDVESTLSVGTVFFIRLPLLL